MGGMGAASDAIQILDISEAGRENGGGGGLWVVYSMLGHRFFKSLEALISAIWGILLMYLSDFKRG